MITLKEAIRYANDLLQLETISQDQVHAWINRDALPGPEKFEFPKGGGRRGLYDPSLPARIATVARLRGYYTIKEIAAIAEPIEGELKRYDSVKDMLEDEKALEKIGQQTTGAEDDQTFINTYSNQVFRSRSNDSLVWDYLRYRKGYTRELTKM